MSVPARDTDEDMLLARVIGCAAAYKSSFDHWVAEQEGNGPDAPSVGGKEGDLRSLVETAIAEIQMFDLPDDDGHLAAADSALWKVLAALSASQKGAEG